MSMGSILWTIFYLHLMFESLKGETAPGGHHIWYWVVALQKSNVSYFHSLLIIALSLHTLVTLMNGNLISYLLFLLSHILTHQGFLSLPLMRDKMLLQLWKELGESIKFLTDNLLRVITLWRGRFSAEKKCDIVTFILFLARTKMWPIMYDKCFLFRSDSVTFPVLGMSCWGWNPL